MICNLIKVNSYNEEFNLHRWTVKLLDANTLMESSKNYKLSDRSIPFSLYEKVSMKDDDNDNRYRIINTFEKEGLVELEGINEKVSYSDIISSKPELEEGFYYCKLLFVYTDINNSTIKTFSSPSFIRANNYYVSLADGYDYSLDFDEEIISTNKYIKLGAKVSDLKRLDILKAQELSSKVNIIANNIKSN